VSWVALSAALAVQGGQSPEPWRVISTPSVHLGVRPAAFLDDEGEGQSLEWGVGITAQLSTEVL